MMPKKAVTVTLELSEQALRLLRFDAKGCSHTLDEHIAAIVEDSAQFDLMAAPKSFRIIDGELHLDGIPL